MELYIKKIDEKAILPSYAHMEDAGMDLYSIENKLVLPSEIAVIRTGIAIKLPTNTEAQIRPRSGLAFKHGITIINSPGTIDEGYIGEIKIALINHGKSTFEIKERMRIAQMVITPIIKVETKQVTNLDETDRGQKGFGSTGLY